MKKQLNAAIVLLGAGLLLAACSDGGMTTTSSSAPADDTTTGTNGMSDNPDAWSGYKISIATTQAMNDDEFENPAMPYVDQAAGIWEESAGASGLSCASCHGAVDDESGGALRIPMKGVGATFPRLDADSGKPINVELQINKCRVSQQYASPFKYESDEMLGMTALVRKQSNGMPIVSTAADPEDELHTAWQAGKDFYYQRRGKLDMACKHCHEDNAANIIRADTLSQGQSEGFPTYRFKWQKPGSLHRRFRGCNKNIRSQPYAYGSDEYLNLETYLAWRGRGLQVAAPAVRK